MLDQIYPVLAALIFFGLLIAIIVVLSAGLTDVLTLFVLTFGLLYGFRTLILVLGLDTPYPDKFFAESSPPAVTTVTILWLSLYLAAFFFAAMVMVKLKESGGTGIFLSRRPSVPRMMIATLALTALAAVISAGLLIKYGGVGGVITASKLTKSLAGWNFLRVPAAIGAIVATATFLEIRATRGRNVLAVVAIVCALLDGFFVFIWGQRSTLVLVGAMLVLGASAGTVRRPDAVKTALRVGLAVILVVAISSGLRVARDTATRGELQTSIARASVARQVSLATNSTYFDAAALAFRDWPRKNNYRDGEDFAVGFAGVVPRIAWAGKPAVVVPGKWFRQVYQPSIVNGWPTGAPAVWYLNFGGLGIVLGGLLSGALLGWISRGQRRAPDHGMNLGIAVVTGIYVLQLGIPSEAPLQFVVWLLPLGMVAWFVSADKGRAPEPEVVASRPGLHVSGAV